MAWEVKLVRVVGFSAMPFEVHIDPYNVNVNHWNG